MHRLNPIQSLRVPFRDELRLQSWIFQAGGFFDFTYRKELHIAALCFVMQDLSQRQTKPMFSNAGSLSGGTGSQRVRADALAAEDRASAAQINFNIMHQCLLRASMVKAGALPRGK
jgi:hypothetical protein